MTDHDPASNPHSRIATDESLRSETNRLALRYYLGLCEDRSLPGRADIHPEDMVSFLRHVILIDVIHQPEPDFRFRLVGTYFRAFWSHDPTGKCFSDLPGRGPDSLIWRSLQNVISMRLPLTTTIPYVGPKRDIFDAEDCVMPLCASDGSVDMLLVTCEYLAKP